MTWTLAKPFGKNRTPARNKPSKPRGQAAPAKRGQPRRRAVPLWRTPVVLAGLGLVLAGSVVGGIAWGWQTGRIAEATEALRWNLITRAADFGFQVRDVQVTGRRQSDRNDILGAVQVTSGAPILAFDAEAAQKRIEALPWVRTATVERRLPDTVLLHLIERRPVALWQNEGAFHLVDGEGVVIPDDAIDRFVGLLVVVGDGAPRQLAALQVLLESEPSLKTRVKTATWVGGRRWNVWLDRGEGLSAVEVRLPEENALEAWQRLARYQMEKNIIYRDITMIDLRLPDRITVRPGGADAEEPGKQRT